MITYSPICSFSTLWGKCAAWITHLLHSMNSHFVTWTVSIVGMLNHFARNILIAVSKNIYTWPKHPSTDTWVSGARVCAKLLSPDCLNSLCWSPLPFPTLECITSRAAAIAESTHIMERESSSRCSQESHNDITEFTMRSLLNFQVWKCRQPFSGSPLFKLHWESWSRFQGFVLGPRPWALDPFAGLALSYTSMSFKGHCLHDIGCHRINDWSSIFKFSNV